MRLESLAVLGAIAASTPALAAQAGPPPAHPRGSFAYNVVGVYQGMTMAPWESELGVADSAAAGARLLVVDYRSRRDATGFVYEYRVVFAPGTGDFVVSQQNRGREPGSYRLTAGGGRLKGPITVAGTTRTLDVPLVTPAVPTFALGAVLAGRELRGGDTIRVGAMPLAAGVGLERVKRFSGVVREDSLARYLEKSREPVWVVKGDAEYPAEFWIAKKDRLVLKALIPQGTDGWMTEEYAGGQADGRTGGPIRWSP